MKKLIPAYEKFWKQCIDFEGKTNKSDYWWAVLAHVIATFAVAIAMGIINGILRLIGLPGTLGLVIYELFAVGSLLPGTAATVRRLRDTGRSWTNAFWALLPFFGWIILCIYLVGDTGSTLGAVCIKKGHEWVYERDACREVCSRCGQTRQRHSYVRVTGKCEERCSVCGNTRSVAHQFTNAGVCKVCGFKDTGIVLRDFTQPELLAMKNAVETMRKVNKDPSQNSVYQSVLNKMNAAQPRLELGEFLVLSACTVAVMQAIGTDVNQFLSMNSNNGLNAANALTVLNLNSALGKLNKIMEEINKKDESKSQSTPAPEGKAAPANTAEKKPLSDFASYDESYQGYRKGGVCDVCNCSLDGMKAYAVPNDMFYASKEYRDFYKKLQKDTFGITLTDTDIDRVRDSDTSPGSAVCENCMHMFAQMPEEKKEEKKPTEKTYTEKDNLGTRQDSQSQATAYWLGERMQKQVKPPFTLFTVPSYAAGEQALLELPFFHKASDSGKLVCDRLMVFGLYEVTENGVSTGEYEVLVCGNDLTLDEFNQAERALTKAGGKRKNSQAPDASVKAPSGEGDAAKVTYDKTEAGNDGVSTYEVYTGPDKASALAFLRTRTVTKNYYYVVVDTPEGSFGRDINGIYEE